jgi:DNA-binding beta-propeller fold protein YncE
MVFTRSTGGVVAFGILAALFVFLSPSVSDASSQENPQMSQVLYAGKVNAPDFPKGLDWLNTDNPLSLRDLRGKVVLLDFWTYCCINCMHVIPELRKLEHKFSGELVVIGVHSAKFTTEQGTQNIREAILRYGLEHPVVNDKDFAVWNSYAVNSWPSFVLIDPDGKVIGKHSGEGIYELFDEIIGKVVAEFDRQGKIDRKPLTFALEKDKKSRSVFAYPGKIAVDAEERRLFITDSNNNRIVILSLPGYAVLETVGSGEQGLKDGLYSEAAFNRPQGVTCVGDTLYIADTENHAIRKVDLVARRVETLAGNGNQARESNRAGRGTGVALNSPWDLIVHGDRLYIAMAGPHQIWSLDLATLQAAPHAGSGRENITDGKLGSAALAQPSGITTDGTKLYVADSEVSAVRSVDFRNDGDVRTIVGEGLFEFGDIDGVGPSVRLQHPVGIAFHDGVLYVADTYNHKIKRIDPRTRRSDTFIGTGKAGAKDGMAREAELNEPNGLCVVKGKMYITDTNNHLIRIYDFATGEVTTLVPRDAGKLMPNRKSKTAFAGEVISIPEQRVREGSGVIRLDLSVPNGYKWNTMAPFYIGLFPENSSVVIVHDSLAERNLENPSFPLEIPVEFRAGTTTINVDLVVYYCEAKTENLCLVKQLRLVVPTHVAKEATDHVLAVGAAIRQSQN